MVMRVTILGCGGSGGVPLTGGIWGNCDPAEPRNRRRRPSILVQQDDTTILVDTSPDMREQLLDVGIRRLDAVLYTHDHADHVHGIDDLRPICGLMKAPIPIWSDAGTLATLQERFGYCFRPHENFELVVRPVLVPHIFDGPFSVGGIEIVPFVQDHGWTTSQGFRFGRFAYSTDAVRLDEHAFAVLEGIDTWIVDCVRLEPAHPVHAHWPVTRSWIERVKPRRAILTHMNQTMDYASLCSMLPPGVEPGFDGLTFEI
jgi:phosphoribosyl 1,2-cyclic phosphate phosphodiesterase